MTTYRYTPESIDFLSRRIRRHHIAAALIFTAVVCAAGIGLVELRTALIYDTIFALVVIVVLVRGQPKALQRTANLLRSIELVIDDEKASWTSGLNKTVVHRSEVAEACFSDNGIWLRSRSRRVSLQIPPEVEDFNKLPALLEEWLPQRVLRRNSPPSSIWAYLQLYGTWAGAALLLFVAMTTQTPLIAIPACILVAASVAWYFAWCGRKVSERKWKILLPFCGYLFAAAFLGRAFMLWATR